jgi:hypothetical protein
MRTTIDLDDALYGRLKMEAARRGRTVPELVAEGIANVLNSPTNAARSDEPSHSAGWRPAWFGTLGRYTRVTSDHSMAVVREGVARKRRRDARR